MAERALTSLNKADATLEVALRPAAFADFTGQAKVKERLEIAVEAALRRKEPLDHILLSGPPGLGKTTIANILAGAMGGTLRTTSGPTIEKAADLAGLLTNLSEGDVLFIDEIHRLQKTIEEYLYPAMEDFKLDIIIDQGPNARSVRLSLPRFTLIGLKAEKRLELWAPDAAGQPRLIKAYPILAASGGAGARSAAAAAHSCQLCTGASPSDGAMRLRGLLAVTGVPQTIVGSSPGWYGFRLDCGARLSSPG